MNRFKGNGERLSLWALLIYTLFSRTGSALKCMDRPDSYAAIIANNTCFWAYPSAIARSWTIARARCSTGYGDLASIAGVSVNALVAQMLTQPSFIGYYKNMAGNWVWANGDGVSYSQAFVDGDPVQMTMANIVGTWTPDFYDVSYLTKGFVCSTPMSQLVCPSQKVAYSVASTPNPVRSSENVTYTCQAGYQMSGGVVSMTATCLSDRTWDVTVPNCTLISCDRFPIPSGLLRNTEAVTVGTNVTYSCSNSRAYFAPGPPTNGRTWTISCQSNGVWSSLPPSCYVYNCDLPPMVQFATLSATDVYSGVTLTYTCLNGYKLPESTGTVVTAKSIQCSANQTTQFWTVTSVSAPAAVPSSCVQISCAAQSMPAFSTSDTNSLTALTTVNVWCNTGYFFADISPTTIVQQTMCQTSTYWTKVFTYGCALRTCTPPVIRNATLVGGNVASSYPYNSTLTYKCVGTLLFPGGNDTFVTTCTDTGDFLPSPPASGCQDGTCQDSWSLFNRYCYFASDYRRGLLRQAAAETSCQRKAGHLVDIQSQEENDFIATFAGLTVFPVLGGDEYWTGWSYVNNTWQWSAIGDVGNFTNWMVGYPDYPDAYWCSSMSLGGQWKDKPCTQMLPYICKKLEVCGLPPAIQNGVLTTSPAPTYGEIGQTISYSCNTGFTFASIRSPTMTITCLAGGYWSRIESCTTGRCAPVTRVVSATLSTTSNIVGTTVTYTCNSGYWFSSRVFSIASNCNSSLLWSRTVPSTCTVVQCPQNMSNATAYFGNASLIGAMNRFTCQPGYIYADGTLTKQFSCSSQGLWLPLNTTCKPAVCPRYVTANGTVSLPGPGSYGQVVKVTCNTGFYLNDQLGSSATATCTAYGTWSQSLPQCQRKPCAPVPVVEMANCTLIGDTAPLAFSKVNCSCINSTVYISGVTWMVAYCHYVSLTWLQVPGRCVDQAVYLQSLNRTVVDAPNALAFGSVGVVIVSAIVIAVFFIDVLTIKMHIRSR